MKFIALILIVSMGFLGLNRFMIALEWMAPATELTCSMDCCTDAEGSCCGDQEHGDDQETESQCQGGCDCSYSIQIVAIGTFIQSPLELSPRLIDHGAYHDNYHNEYLPPHFQPPRMA